MVIYLIREIHLLCHLVNQTSEEAFIIVTVFIFVPLRIWTKACVQLLLK